MIKLVGKLAKLKALQANGLSTAFRQNTLDELLGAASSPNATRFTISVPPGVSQISFEAGVASVIPETSSGYDPVVTIRCLAADVGGSGGQMEVVPTEAAGAPGVR